MFGRYSTSKTFDFLKEYDFYSGFKSYVQSHSKHLELYESIRYIWKYINQNLGNYINIIKEIEAYIDITVIKCYEVLNI